MIEWNPDINKQIKRGTGWKLPLGVILENTRSGKKKSRPANQLEGKIFDIQMIFSYEEYLLFENWYTINLRNGAETFSFPDVFNSLVNKEYRIVSTPTFSNESGKVIKCSMQWEEVR